MSLQFEYVLMKLKKNENWSEFSKFYFKQLKMCPEHYNYCGSLLELAVVQTMISQDMTRALQIFAEIQELEIYKGYTERAVTSYLFLIEVLLFHFERSKWYSLQQI